MIRSLDEALLGFLVKRDYRGRGYATEAARAVVDYGFEQLGLARILAGCDPENEASRRVLEKIGMRTVGLRRGFPGSLPGSAALVFTVRS